RRQSTRISSPAGRTSSFPRTRRSKSASASLILRQHRGLSLNSRGLTPLRAVIYDPPVLLYVRGDPQILNLPSLSIVGTRRPTFYGTPMGSALAGSSPRGASS